MSKINDKAEALEMTINAEKIEVQYIGKTNEVVDVSLHGNALKQVKEFTYLGSIIASNGIFEKDIDRRINLARPAFNSLKKIWAARDILKVH